RPPLLSAALRSRRRRSARGALRSALVVGAPLAALRSGRWRSARGAAPSALIRGAPLSSSALRSRRSALVVGAPLAALCAQLSAATPPLADGSYSAVASGCERSANTSTVPAPRRTGAPRNRL